MYRQSHIYSLCVNACNTGSRLRRWRAVTLGRPPAETTEVCVCVCLCVIWSCLICITCVCSLKHCLCVCTACSACLSSLLERIKLMIPFIMLVQRACCTCCLMRGPPPTTHAWASRISRSTGEEHCSLQIQIHFLTPIEDECVSAFAIDRCSAFSLNVCICVC